MVEQKKDRKSLKRPDPQGFRPSEFMRARRPELFPDSKTTDEPQLTRAVFEYHLDSLTNRRQETQFEDFCRRISEKELCPNLRPQTGPTGGGDSKVDAENYPVAECLSLRWYEGKSTEAGQDRWAFAFSAKRDWHSKATSDVKKIVKTRRGYKQIYFITNQFAKDKSRAKLEDNLSKWHKIPVRILDRAWITKCVFEHDRIQLAIDTLGLSGFETAKKRVPGPLDVEREAQLQELEQQINDLDRYRGIAYQLGEDCILAALVARGLGRPRAEVDGKFARAERVISKNGNRQQRLRLAYNQAWTAYWWFDDFEELTRIYDLVEELSIESDQSSDLELLANLWTALSSSCTTGRLTEDAAKLKKRTKKLQAALERVAADARRPNNALWAHTNRLLMDIPEAIGVPASLQRILQEFRAILASAQGLVSYPFETVSKIVRELRSSVGDSSLYDDLIEDLSSVIQRRVSESEAGRILLEHGLEKLREHRPYEAIRILGRAQQKLAVEECRAELTTALYACGQAYASAGLLWAARANVLAAANQALSEYTVHGVVLPHALRCLQSLVWLELQLGRVPHVLKWIEVASVIAQYLLLPEIPQKAYLEERTSQDMVLAILLLKTDLAELGSLDFLPSVLDRFGLDFSRMALLFALGYEDELRKEGTIPETEKEEDVLKIFCDWLNQPAATDIPNKPSLLNEDRVTLRSNVLGCEIIASVENTFDQICLTERILCALEAMLATSLNAGVIPHSSEFAINVRTSDSDNEGPEVSFEELNPCVDIELSARVSSIRELDGSWIQDLITRIAGHIVFIEDPESFARKIFGEEQGLARAINFSDSTIPIENILGPSPRLRIAEWQKFSDSKKFPPRRNVRWDDGIRKPPHVELANDKELKFAGGPPPKELFEADRIKHRDRAVYSLINIGLWDRAGWRGILYLFSPELDRLPLIALAFSNAEAAQAIFKGWREKLGEVDKTDMLRFSILTGIDERHPFSYKAVLGINPPFVKAEAHVKEFVLGARILRMDPQSSKNLDAFLVRYNRLGRYTLLPAVYSDDTEKSKVFPDLWIGKEKLRVVPAWQIGEHDQDSMAIEPNDDPIIPSGVDDAPVLRLLMKKRAKVKS